MGDVTATGDWPFSANGSLFFTVPPESTKQTAKPHMCHKKQAAPLRVLLMEPLWWAYFQVLDRGSACLMTEC